LVENEPKILLDVKLQSYRFKSDLSAAKVYFYDIETLEFQGQRKLVLAKNNTFHVEFKTHQKSVYYSLSGVSKIHNIANPNSTKNQLLLNPDGYVSSYTQANSDKVGNWL